MIKIARIALLFLFISAVFPVNGQVRVKGPGLTRLEWKEVQAVSTTSQGIQRFLFFEGAQYNAADSSLPSFFQRIKLPAGATGASAVLADAIYLPLTAAEENAIRGRQIPSSIEPKVQTGSDRKETYAYISFVPLRVNASTGKPEKLAGFRLQTTPTYGARLNASNQRVYSPSSVLATGEWYRIGVTQTGIHKLSYDLLQQLGIDVSSIDPNNIKVYGNGGAQLPFANYLPRPDDLVQDAIYVQGEGDHVFDPSDYILFYGEAPGEWYYSYIDQRFHHKAHLYSDTTYYFITVDGGLGKRIATLPSAAGGTPVTTFDDYAFHESDAVNLIKSGREWYGENFETTNSLVFPFLFPDIDASAKGYIKVDVGSRSASSATYNITCGDTTGVINTNGSSLCPTCDFIQPLSTNFLFTPTGPNVNVTVNKATASAAAWINYIEVNVRRHLIMNRSQFSFRDRLSVGPGNIAAYQLSDALFTVQVWDVSDPTNARQMSTVLNGTTLEFSAAADTLREFIAFNGASFFEPVIFGKVENQDLHALGFYNMIIVAHPLFMEQANKLADMHREQDGLSVLIVTPQQIYNEFSSGMQDVSAIRDFVKMFYDRAVAPSDQPEYLLLFGDGSYDNKHRFNPNSNFIPTYQSLNSYSPTASYVSDDFFGLLDDNEGQWSPNDNDVLDIGIGRFPVRTVQEAEAAVNKAMHYTNAVTSAPVNACDPSGEKTSFGDWRNVVCFVADDEDGDLHLTQAESIAKEIDTLYGTLNVDKIYLDAYQQISASGGERYPDAAEALTKRVEKGALVINYTGHGGELGLTSEDVLNVSTINKWDNINNLPLFVTATCEFSRFDDPERTSAGEYVFLNPDGGGIALLSTVRLVYAAPNHYLNTKFYDYAFEPQNGEMPRLGDLFRLTKVSSGPAVNNRNFTLLGDPAIRLAYPKHNVVTTHVNHQSINVRPQDTLKALSVVTISGYVADANGVRLTGYNGMMYPTVYDKVDTIKTLANDGNQSPSVKFTLLKSILFKGRATVTNGEFSFSFVVPKDIDPAYGPGKISYYALAGKDDAAGYYEGITIGGYDSTAANDVTGPVIKLYMNDSSFVFGDQTHTDPQLYAVISDSTGINTVGLGIGHDMIAVLDEDATHPIVLNDNFSTDPNSFRTGSIRYPFYDLEEGTHSVSVKVWDVNNNSAQSYTEFVVATSAKLALKHVLNYPNPFTTRTQFRFEYNQACDMLDVQVQVFTVSGKLVKTLSAYVHTDGKNADPIEWDGTDEFGDRIGKGVYIYRLRVRNSLGETAERYERLVILK